MLIHNVLEFVERPPFPLELMCACVFSPKTRDEMELKIKAL